VNHPHHLDMELPKHIVSANYLCETRNYHIFQFIFEFISTFLLAPPAQPVQIQSDLKKIVTLEIKIVVQQHDLYIIIKIISLFKVI
jgi:hypothetical protein